MGGFATVMQSAGTVTITINGKIVTVPGMQSLAQKDASGEVPVSQDGTGSITAAEDYSNLGISDRQLKSVNSRTGGTISSPTSITGDVSIVTQKSSYGD